MIRKMRIEDYEQVHSLWQTCSGVGINSIDDSKDNIERFIDKNNEICLVAEENNEIVGTVLAGYDGRRAYIYHTAVRDDMRRQGIGKKLVEEELKQFESIGVSKAAGVVFVDNISAQEFWKKCGFTVRKDLYYIGREVNK